MRTILRRLFIVAAVVGVFLFLTSVGRPPRGSDGSTAPRSIEFKELALDAQSLAKAQAYIEIVGVYQGLSADLEMLYPPTHTALSMGDDAIRLWTQDSSRDVRELLYGCRQRDSNALNVGNFDAKACRVRAIGRMNTCYLKIAMAAEFPCLMIERLDVL
jgi:hypothetical protein